jgi:hypothetical protein
MEGTEQCTAELLEKILDRNNLNRAFKRVKANKGAPGIDGRTVGETLTYLKKETITMNWWRPSNGGNTAPRQSGEWKSQSQTEVCES